MPTVCPKQRSMSTRLNHVGWPTVWSVPDSLMPARRWTTDDQLLWLDDHITAFTDTQKKKTTNAFFEETHHIWQEKWPTENLTEQELQRAEGNIECTLTVN